MNFIPIADITFLHEDIFDALYEDSIKVAGIKYCPANFLRMNMYLELSRPMGDVSRWEKVFKRLVLLNNHYPVNPSINCDMVEFQKKMEEKTLSRLLSHSKPDKSSSSSSSHQNLEKDLEEDIHNIIRDTLISMDAIFIGGYACTLYSEYMTEKEKRKVQKTADFDVIIEDIEKAAVIIKEHLEEKIQKKIVMVQHAEISEIIPRHIEIKIDDDSVAFLYEPIACHNYNKITIENEIKVNVATIDTLLSFYLAFMYAKKKYYNKDKILCMAMFLFDVQEKNRLKQKGLLKRFSLLCIGKQTSLEQIRSDKAEKYKELKDKRNTPEYDEWFLKYNPHLGRRHVLKKNRIKKQPDFVFSPATKETKVPLSERRVTKKKKKRGKGKGKGKGPFWKKTKKEFLF